MRQEFVRAQRKKRKSVCRLNRFEFIDVFMLFSCNGCAEFNFHQEGETASVSVRQVSLRGPNLEET